MHKAVVFGIIISVIATILFLISDPIVSAKQQSKIHFTKTISSFQNPVVDQDGQFALILSPNKNSLYTGSLSFTANQPIEALILHEITNGEIKGQPTLTVDGNTTYGVSVLEAKNAGSLDFTGAALAFQSKTPFVVTVSLDGWIRGQPIETAVQRYEIKEKEFFLQKSHVPVMIPMHGGFFDKGQVYYLITDSSNKTLAEKIANNQEWNVNFAPKLRWMPDSAQDTIYAFTNGIKGNGIYGFQGEVFANSPEQKEPYTPLQKLSTISWKTGQKPQVLESAQDILKAEKESRIKIFKTNVTINAPQIVWPNGQLLVKNSTASNNFANFQVIEINRDSKQVTFIAHRAWNQDGSTIYHIITDATPNGPADLMGVPSSVKLGKTASPNVSEMYQFKNGIRGAGPLGFQPSVIHMDPKDKTPICRVSIVEWKESTNATILETISDISSKKSDGSIYVTLARPLSEDHVINCPIIELPTDKG